MGSQGSDHRHQQHVDLSQFSNSDFDRGASRLRETLWLLVRSLLFLYFPFGLYRVKRSVLIAFGAKIGKGVTIKPGAKIVFPWKLQIDDYAWIGEDSMIINLGHVRIGKSACVSQRAVLCTGSHDYSKTTFDLITQDIVVQDGSWIAAGAWVGPGVTVGSHAILAAGSVTNKDLEPYGIYQGNPAVKVRERVIES